MQKEKQYNVIIPLKGLALGEHQFDIELTQSLFDLFENQDIHDAKLNAHIVLEKQASWIRLDIDIDGTVGYPCDRCLDDVILPILYKAPLMVKFSKTHGEEETEELMILDPADAEIDLTQYLYDSLCLSLPLQSLHPRGKCNPTMLAKLKNYE